MRVVSLLLAPSSRLLLVRPCSSGQMVGMHYRSRHRLPITKESCISLCEQMGSHNIFLIHFSSPVLVTKIMSFFLQFFSSWLSSFSAFEIELDSAGGRRTRWFVFKLSICFRNRTVHKSLQRNLITSRLSVNRGRSRENLCMSIRK